MREPNPRHARAAALAFESLTDIQRVGHENGVRGDSEDELMVPGVGHLLALGHAQLHVHGCHGDGALLDPVCEPRHQLDAPARIKVEEPTHHPPSAGLLCPLDQLSVSGTFMVSETENLK